MVEKIILVLANSKKYNNRCVAWILLQEKNGSLKIERDVNNNVIWIRPVWDTEDWAIPLAIAENYPVWSIMKFTSLWSDAKYSYQSENEHVEPTSIEFIWYSYLSKKFLCEISQNEWEEILWLYDKDINQTLLKWTKSLVTIRPKNIEFHETTNMKWNKQIRCVVDFGNDTSWDIPITDTLFLNKIDKLWIEFFNTHTYEYFITISLGVPFNGKIYMLAAWMLYEESESPANEWKHWDNVQHNKIVELHDLWKTEEEIAIEMGRKISVIRNKLSELCGGIGFKMISY